MPEAISGVDSGPGEGAVELGRVDGTEGICAHGVLAKIGGEDGHGEGGFGVVEKGLLRSWLDGVEFGEGEADEPVGLGVLDEGSGDGGGELNGLAGHSCSSNVDGVCTDVASCS